jgi:hypothetical protein
MTRQTLQTIRKYLVTARVPRPEEDEFFTALKELDRLLDATSQRVDALNS